MEELKFKAYIPQKRAEYIIYMYTYLKNSFNGMVDTIELLSEEQGKIHDRIDIDKLHQGGADG